MREILFRGKRIYNGEWVYGDFFRSFPSYFIPGYRSYIKECAVKGGVYEVDFSTVGQYTGATDKNGKKIFEGDIVKIRDDELPFIPECYKGNIGTVVFEDGAYATHFVDGFGEYLCMLKDDIEVIGNIHDNPELLEVKG